MQATASPIVPFQFDAATVRAVVGADGEPWFVAADVSAVLEYRGAPDMTRILDADEKGTQIVRTPGGEQEMTVINESGLYSAVLRSRKPEAKRFKRWVTAEVLPSIRKTGSYNAAPVIDLNDPAFLRSTLLIYTEKVIALESQVKAAAPKVEFHDKYAAAEGNKGIREVAKLLHANERTFVDFLVASNFMYRLHGRLTPTAYHHHAGRFEVKAGVSENDHAFNQAMFTPKGITWIAAEWAKYESAIAA